MKTTTKNPLFILAAAGLRIGEKHAFPDIRWIFARDQHWAIVGANGSGKTLLASALAGGVPWIEGGIEYGFRLPAGRTPEEAVILVSFELQKAIVGEAPAASRWFSLEEDQAVAVRQFLSQNSIEEINPFEVVERSPRTALAFGRHRQRVLRLLQIEPLWDRLLPTLSNGEMRKLLLARALLRRPRLLILDDVFAGLDAGFRIHLKHILEGLMKQRSFGLLLISDRPKELPRGITHLLCLDRCRIVAQGRRKAMISHPRVRKLFTDADRHTYRQALHSLPAWKGRQEDQELFRLDKVVVQYDDQVILQNISWIVRRGESWALLGPNGSGKSTLLSLITGDNPQAYANCVFLFGRRRGSGESVWELKKRIGQVSPELHLHFPETQTCLETVISGFHDSYGCFQVPTPPQRFIARQWLACFGLADCAEQSFGSLSAGLQRMTLLARALVKSPCLLLLDEPCQGLDRAHRRLFLSTIETLLQHSDTTIIYVTHRSDEVPQGLGHVIHLRHGRITRMGRIGGKNQP